MAEANLLKLQKDYAPEHPAYQSAKIIADDSRKRVTARVGARSASRLVSQYGDGPVVSLLTRDQSELWFFKTRDGSKGVLQIVGFTEEPEAVKIRYKLLVSAANEISAEKREELSARLEAAAMIGSQTERDKALAQVATDAARVGKVDTASAAINRIGTSSTRDQASLDAVRLLAKRGLRKEAIHIAQRISSSTTRDLALSELA
ncbi:MAG: hypothetical protein DME26_21040, partial [Verrucomicrobia bacterium]